MARVFVTGGAGYVGSHAARCLAEAGHEVIVYDNLSRGHADFVRWGPLIEGDIRDTERVTAALKEHGCDAVMHFAAFAYVGESVEKPEIYYHNNVCGTWSLLEAMRAAGVHHIVFSSTCAVYGVPPKLPISEDTPPDPVNPYGFSKLTAERMMQDYERAHGIRSVCLRYFNAAGADPEGEIGERHEPETHLIPLVIMAALGRLDHVNVLGTDYPTPDGSAVRDYIHVTDLARAHLAALDHLLGGGESCALNLGTGRGASVLEVIATVEEVLGRKVPVRLADRRPGDPPELVADPSRAEQVLGWRASGLSDLKEIVRTAARWHEHDTASTFE